MRDDKGGYMNRPLFLIFVGYSLFVVSPTSAAADNQIWQVRAGDTLEIITMTLQIPKEEIKKHNPGVLENNIQIGQKLKLPLSHYLESKTLQEELNKKDGRIGKLESTSSDLERRLANAESRLRWHPVWLWGFWICFGVLAFVAYGVHWIFRQTHPQVFEQPHERSIGDIKESEKRARPPFPYEEQGASIGRGQWQLSLRFPHAR
jgi:LysM repeat protein